jgi:cysteine dioxygenase
MSKRATIQSLDRLVTMLDECERRSNCYNDIMRMLRLDTQVLSRFVHFSPHHYTRNLVFRTMDYELVVKCWLPGQASEIHDHNGQESWMLILEGELTEQRFTLATLSGKLQPVGEARLGTGLLSYIHDNIGLHRVINKSDNPAVSFHLYVLPVEFYHSYEEITGQAERVSMRYDSHGGVILG